MCGIVGAVGRLNQSIVDAVGRMNDSQRLRGPDSAGRWESGDVARLADVGGGAAFGFRRLKIIDLSPEADQPMHDRATGNVLVFNGEIYNFRLLRAELESLGHRFHTAGDSEVILRGYAQWGDAVVPRLRGMFGLAIWDAAARRVLLARDRVGIKPLYLARAEGGAGAPVLFASQVRALLASGLVPRRIDPVGLSTFIWNGFVVGPGTIIQGVRQLPPGCTATITAEGQLTERRYWQLPPPTARRATEEDVRASLEESVSQHLVSDVPLGVFLSGGRDSSAVSAIAARVSPKPIRTFTIAFEEAKYSEARYARQVADLLKTEHQEVPLSEQVFREHLEDALAGIDQPTFDAINSYFVSRAVREAGLTVAMAGTGGDELFGGYRSFRDLPAIRRQSRQAAFVPRWLAHPVANAFARLRAGAFGSFPPQTRWGKFADALDAKGDLPSLYQVAYGLFTSDFAHQLMPGGNGERTTFGLPRSRVPEFDALVSGRTDLDAIAAMELSMFLSERLLRDTDAASMEVSLEVRVPLLDHVVIETVFNADDDIRFQPLMKKSLLHRAAMPNLPESLFDRPKSGFELPLDVWCRQGLRETVAATLTDSALCRSIGLDAVAVAALWNAYERGAPGLYWSRVWGLYTLLWWCRRHEVTA